ncbi:MAG: cellulase family glycosylhydrolase [bacterium]
MLRSLSGLLVLFVSALAYAQHPSLPPPIVPEGFGVAIHFTQPQPGELEKLAASGVRWVRMDMVWEDTEREKDRYNFSAYDSFVKALEEHRLKALFILDYWNPHYDQGLSPYSEAGRQAFARWAAAAASRYAGKGFLWEVWNEPNGGIFWKPKPKASDYAQLALAVGKAFRAAGLEKEALIGPASYQVPYQFLKTCFEAGLLEYWSAVSIHPYRWWLNPETAARSFERTRNLIARYAPPGKIIPVLSGEWGYSTVDLGMNEAKQAQFLPRMWLSNLSQGVPVSIWYDWKDDGENPKEREHHFGIVHRDFRKEKPAYLAAKALNDSLRDYRLLGREPVGGSQDYALRFEKEGVEAWAVWTSAGRKTLAWLPVRSGSYRVIGPLGEKLGTIQATPKGLGIVLENGPKYLLNAESASSDPGRAGR